MCFVPFRIKTDVRVAFRSRVRLRRGPELQKTERNSPVMQAGQELEIKIFPRSAIDSRVKEKLHRLHQLYFAPAGPRAGMQSEANH